MSIKFCEVCKSIVVRDNCSNKKCVKHLRDLEVATYKQIDYIKELSEKLKDDTEYNFHEMTVKEASEIIDELKERFELGIRKDGF